MKKHVYRTLVGFFGLILIGCSSVNINSRGAVENTTKKIVEVDYLGGIAINNNQLYFGREGGISKIDVSAPVPIEANVVDRVESKSIHSLIQYQDYIYFAEFEKGSVYKINISDIDHKVTEVSSNLFGPDDMVIYNNYLYIAEFYGGRVSRIDLRDDDSDIEDYVVGIYTPSGLAIKDHKLYISQFKKNKVSVVDLNDQKADVKDVVTDVIHPDGLLFIGNDLLIAEYDGGRITRANITANIPRSRTVVGNIGCPSEMTIKDNDLYISCIETDEVRTFKLTKALINSCEFNYYDKDKKSQSQ